MRVAGTDFRFIEAGLLAQNVLKDRGVNSLAIDPMALAENQEIAVRAKSADAEGVSVMLNRYGQEFCIAYATHIQSEGFWRFSVAHELGHYFLPGHIDHILPNGLWPRLERAFRQLKRLQDVCNTSLTATAIRYAQAADGLVAAIVSQGKTIDYAFMSDELKGIKSIRWMRKGTPLSKNTATFEFNSDPGNVSDSSTVESDASLLEWFTADVDLEMTEEIVGLG